MPSVSQQEYDVTAYHNVLDQLQTAEGTINEVMPYLKAELATSLFYLQTRTGANRKLSGFMMKEKGGKSQTRWSEVIGSLLGYGPVKVYGDRSYSGINWKRIRSDIKKWSGYGGQIGTISHRTSTSSKGRGPASDYETSTEYPDFSNTIQSYVYDLHSLMRNVNWTLNRLRIEMPFDLRQLTNQLNSYANDISYVNPYITTYKIYVSVRNIQKSVLPKMRSKLRALIKAANLQQKVAENQMRAENEQTITKAERDTKSVPATSPETSPQPVRQTATGVTMSPASSAPGATSAAVTDNGTSNNAVATQKKKSLAVPVGIVALLAMFGQS